MNTPKKKRTFGNILFTLRFAAKYSPLYLWMKMLFSVLNAVQEFVEGVLAIKILLDIMENGRPFSDALWFMLAVFGFNVLLNLPNHFVYAYVNPRDRKN